MHVYILKLANGKHYTGITNNLNKRLQQHQNGESKSTKAYLPVRLIFCVKGKNREEARAIEVIIKDQGAKQFLGDKDWKSFADILDYGKGFDC